MNMIRWRTPTRPLAQMERTMQRLFDEPFRLPFVTEDMGWMPAVEVSETDSSIQVTAELPGVAKEDVSVDLDDNVLTIRGEKKEEKKVEQAEQYLVERYYGSFQRSFTLPAPVDPEKVRAEFNNGVLTVKLEKNGRARGRRIEING